jgi:hypothetical protein
MAVGSARQLTTAAVAVAYGISSAGSLNAVERRREEAGGKEKIYQQNKKESRVWPRTARVEKGLDTDLAPLCMTAYFCPLYFNDLYCPILGLITMKPVIGSGHFFLDS